MQIFRPSTWINPARSPVYYGYVVMLLGTLGIWASIPGQTIGVSVFTDPVKDALGLSRNQFSNAYMIGTIISSQLIGRAGVWFDRYGARNVAFFAAMGLAFSVLLCSWAVTISETISNMLSVNSWWVPFLLMTTLFFMLRFSGQGVLTMASRNVIMIWFDRHRGKVNMFSSIALSFGFSISPLWLNALIDGYGWQGAWKVLALALLAVAVVIALFFKDKPERYGLLPDGASAATQSDADSPAAVVQYSLAEARKTRAFWMYTLALAFNSFFITGFTFHVVSIFASHGFSQQQAISIFLPCSVVSVTVSTLFNYLSDYLRLKWLLYLMLLGGVSASLGMILMSNLAGIPLLVVAIGMMGGLFAVLNAIAWPRFYGRTNLGAITGKAMSFVILASALAPSIFSLSYTWLGSYRYLGILGLSFLAFMILASLAANNPQPERAERK